MKDFDKLFEAFLRNKIEETPKDPKYLHTVTNVGYKLTPFGQA